MALKCDLHTALYHAASVRCSRSIVSCLSSSHSRTFKSRCQTIVPGPDSAALLAQAPAHTRSIPCAASRASQLNVNDNSTPPSSSNGSTRSKVQSDAGKSATRSRTARGRFSSRRGRDERKSQQDLQSTTRSPDPVAWYEQPTAAPTAAHAAAAAAAAAIPTPKQVTRSSNDLTAQPEEHIAQQHPQQDTSISQASTVSSSSSSSSRGNTLTAELSDNQVQQLQQYLSHMLEVNKSMNLTAIRDPDEAWQRHIEDSLALLPIVDKYSSSSSSSDHSPAAAAAAAAATLVIDHISISSRGRTRRSTIAAAATAGHAAVEGCVQQGPDMQQQQHPAHQQQQLSVIDVGTGAGLPGLVFAIARPHWKVTLLDSLRKRCDFLQATADMLGLSNVTVVWSRAEEGGRRADLREAHDLAVARAVADLRVLSELCLPFVKPGGLWVAAKGANPEDEVSAAHTALTKLGGNLTAVERVESWSPEGRRTAVVVTKSSSTPSRFPRSPGTPGRKPL